MQPKCPADNAGHRDDLTQRKALRWQCRRGMRELDVLLTGWLVTGYDDVADDEKAAFQRLLSLPDPELARYLLAGEPATDPGIARVVQSIRRHPPG